MAEQYIYSRAEREFTNALNQTVSLGFGFVALSPGMDETLQRNVAVHCEDFPHFFQTDSQGVPLPFFRKARLPKGRVLLQESTWIEGEGRDFHVAHGYVLGDGELINSSPSKWFDILFRLENPNTEEDGIPLESRLEFIDGAPFHAKSLKETVGSQGLSPESFCQLLLACFDALASRRQVLISWDFDRPGERELRYSVLYWIYTFLPYRLWSDLGFDNVYTDKSSPGQTHLAFVGKTSIRTVGQTYNIRIGSQSLSLEGNFLVLDGKINHNDSKYATDWYRKNSIYARWLEQSVNMLWECSEEDRPSIIQALDEFQKSFQKELDTYKERGDRDKEQLDPQWYGVVCMWIFKNGPPQVLSEICNQVSSSATADEQYDFNLTFMDLLEEPDRRSILMSLLKDHKENNAPVGEKDISMLRALFENGLEAPAADLLSVFMAQEADARKEVTAVMNRYQGMLPSKLYSMLPERVFFSRDNEECIQLWAECGVDSSDKAAEQRRYTWFKEIIPENKSIWDMPDIIEQTFEEMNGLFSAQQKAELWQEFFKDRCGAVSKSKEELTNFANDEELPRQFKKVRKKLSSLPGGILNVEDELDALERNAYNQLLENPTPFMNSRWLRDAFSNTKIGGEVGDMLEILSAFTDVARNNVQDLIDCYKGVPMETQRRVVQTLSKMFLKGTLPNIGSKYVEIFLLPYRDSSQQILLQAASQRGSSLLVDLLMRTKKHEVKYLNMRAPEDPTLFNEIKWIIETDRRIKDKLRERGDVEHLEKFLQEEGCGDRW